MRRQLSVAVIAALMFAAGVADLSACGDKFLRVGRSARFRGYAAVHPSSILVYRPAKSTSAGIREFEALLKRAGHKPVVVERGADLSQALAAAQYDVVIADYADSAQVNTNLQSVSSKPSLLPILDKPTKAVAIQAEKEYHCLIKLHAMTKYDALEEIDHLVGMRLGAK